MCFSLPRECLEEEEKVTVLPIIISPPSFIFAIPRVSRGKLIPLPQTELIYKALIFSLSCVQRKSTEE